MNRDRKLTGLTSPNRSKNRRTSLNVNLSYISNRSSLTEEDETIHVNSSVTDNTIDDNLEKTIIARRELPVRRNLSIRRSVAGKHALNTRNSGNANVTKIKPSFVRMVRINTSTPIKNRDEKITSGQTSEEILVPSENTRRSSVLEDVRFPLDGEIFSPSASIVMETSMDMTEVQGKTILHIDPGVPRVSNEIFNDNNRINDSLGMIQDTEDIAGSSYYAAPRICGEPVIIPDSQQDSTNTIRTSLNVNTSIDSRFSSVPNNSLYDPRKSRNVEMEQPEDIVSYPSSQSSYGNIPTNSIVVTTAVIERENTSNNMNYQETDHQESTIDLDSTKESHPLHNSTLHNSIRSQNDKSLNGKDSANDSCWSATSSSTNQDHENFRLKVSNNENNDPGESDLEWKTIKRGKKKLLTMRRSEMVDLSPVSVQIRPIKRTEIQNRRRRRNKTAKKVTKENDNAAKKIAAIYPSDDDDDTMEAEMEEDLEPRKEKKIRKLKAKEIVIKKPANHELWKKLNGNSQNTVNESCDEISSALGRTSLDDFQVTKSLVSHKKRQIKPKIIIVASGLPIEEKLAIKGTVTTLGSARLEKIVTRYTTHVVSRGTRTVNLLRGIVRGCWLVSFEWISKSRIAGKWVDPQKYEMTGFSKAVQENRKEKQLFGAAYVSELFLTCGLIHIKEETSTPAQVLRELVRIAGGRVAAKPEEAKIIIGKGGFKEIWILDSIANGEVQPLELYSKKNV